MGVEGEGEDEDEDEGAEQDKVGYVVLCSVVLYSSCTSWGAV